MRAYGGSAGRPARLRDGLGSFGAASDLCEQAHEVGRLTTVADGQIDNGKRDTGPIANGATASGSGAANGTAAAANGATANGAGTAAARIPAKAWDHDPVLDGSVVPSGRRRIPEATVARLPVYLRCLMEVAGGQTTTISSERLAEMAGVNAAKVRKDLSYLGSYGTRGVGYEVEYLLLHINRVLGLTQDWPVLIVGIGNLGHALANYRGFPARGFRIAALVDSDGEKVGEHVAGLVVQPLDDLPAIVESGGVAIGIIATPAAAAQDVADRLCAAGVSSILNFAPAIINVPRGVSVRKVDLSIELQILSFYQQRRLGSARDAEAPAVPQAAGIASWSASP